MNKWAYYRVGRYLHSPYLFAAYIDDVINFMRNKHVGCMYHHYVNACIVMYADDILLLAPSVHVLQILVSACESKFGQLYLGINVRRSVCIRIGLRCHFSCSPILMSDGSELQWVDSVRYLGVFVTRSTHFSCSFDKCQKVVLPELTQMLTNCCMLLCLQ